MIIGIDTVEIARFIQWRLKPKKQLLRIFSEHEIDYCLALAALSAQRFAVRFALREAFYKAFIQISEKIPAYLTMCKAITVIHHKRGFPYLVVDWKMLESTERVVSISLTHTKTSATAIVCFSRI